MKRFGFSRFSAIRAISWTALIPGLLAPVTLSISLQTPVLAQEQQIEAATSSKLLPIKLPSGGFRALRDQDISQFAAALDKVAGPIGRVERREVLLWQGNAEPRPKIVAALKAAGFQYKEQDPIKQAEGQVIAFTAARPDKKGGVVVGVWTISDAAALLAWGTVGTSDAPATPVGDTEEASTENPNGLSGGSGDWEAASTSRIAAVKLPAKAARSKNTSFNDNMSGNLKQLVSQSNYDVTPVEVLLWEGDAASNKAANRDAVSNALKKSGFEVQTQGPVKNEQGNTYMFMAIHSAKQDGYIGCWIEGPVQMLVWGKLVKK
ncbi:MAG: hypothetical protein OHK0029_34750 [Armatimonadaceae bacterium]